MQKLPPKGTLELLGKNTDREQLVFGMRNRRTTELYPPNRYLNLATIISVVFVGGVFPWRLPE